MDEVQAKKILEMLGGIRADIQEVKAVQHELAARIAVIERGAVAQAPVVEIKSPLAKGLMQPQDDVILCLDFGTARSKAFATRGEESELLDVAVGERSGSSIFTHSVASVLYIDGEGQIHFGDRALEVSEEPVQSGSRDRIDDLKVQYIHGPDSERKDVLLTPRQNPSSTPLSAADILALFLAYLTDMAVTELEARSKASRYVLRRFTIPAFERDKPRQVSARLVGLYREAALLADHFHGRWSDGIPANEAKAAITAARSLAMNAAPLVEPMGVAEPVAAVSSVTRERNGERGGRSLVAVVDIGAGTTDIGTFTVGARAGDPLVVQPVSNSSKALEKAGNHLDQLLHNHIVARIKEENPALPPSQLNAIKASLNLAKRANKERLFRDGRLSLPIQGGMPIELDLETFQASPGYCQFLQEVRATFVESLKGVDASVLETEAHNGMLAVFLTGGGATLPGLADALKPQIQVTARVTHVRVSRPIPKWVTDRGQAGFTAQFSQLAVAIGGASRTIPTHLTAPLETTGGIAGPAVLDRFRIKGQ